MKKGKYLLIALTLFLVFGTNVKAATNRPLQDGYYTIFSSANSNYAVDLKSGKIANSQNIQIYQSNESEAQQWKVKYLGNGYYSITSKKAVNYSLDVKGAGKKNGTNVQLYKSNNSIAQQWMIKEAGNGYYYIVSRCNGLYVDIKSGKIVNSQNIQMYKGNKSKAQKFTFNPVVSGYESVESREYVLASALNTNYVVDLKSGKLANGQNIQLYKYNHSDAQIWKISYKGNGYYSILSSKSNQYSLDISAGGKVRGTNIQLWKANASNKNQQFNIVYAGGGYYTISGRANGLPLDVSGGIVANSQNIQIYTSNNTNSQKFKLIPAVRSLSTPTIAINNSGDTTDGRTGYDILTNTKDDIDGIEYYRSNEETGKFSFDSVSKEKKTTMYTTKTGEYWYIKARTYKEICGVKVYSDFSNVLSYGTKLVEPDVAISYTTSGEDTSYYLQITDLSQEASGMEVYYSSTKDGKYTYLSDASAAFTNKKYEYKLTKNGYYKVRAYLTINGVKSYGEFSDVVGLPDDAPSIDTLKKPDVAVNYTTSGEDAGYYLQITDLSQEEASGIEVYYSSTKDGKYTYLSDASAAFTNKKYEYKLTKNGYYKVRAYLAINGIKSYGEFSDVVEVLSIDQTVEDGDYYWYGYWDEENSDGSVNYVFEVGETSIDYDGIEVYESKTENGEYQLVATSTTEKDKAIVKIAQGKYAYYKVKLYKNIDNGQKKYIENKDVQIHSNIELSLNVKSENALSNGDMEYELEITTNAAFSDTTKFELLEDEYVGEGDSIPAHKVTDLTLGQTYKITVKLGENRQFFLTVQPDENSTEVISSDHLYLSRLIEWEDLIGQTTNDGMSYIFSVNESPVEYDGFDMYESNTLNGEYSFVSTSTKEENQATVVVAENKYKFYRIKLYTLEEGQTKKYVYTSSPILRDNMRMTMEAVLNEETDENTEYKLNYTPNIALPEEAKFVLYVANEDGELEKAKEYSNNEEKSYTVSLKKGTTKEVMLVIEIADGEYSIMVSDFTLGED